MKKEKDNGCQMPDKYTSQNDKSVFFLDQISANTYLSSPLVSCITHSYGFWIHHIENRCNGYTCYTLKKNIIKLSRGCLLYIQQCLNHRDWATIITCPKP